MPLALPIPFVCVAMALAWWRQRRTQNAGLVDVLWAAGIGVVGVLFTALGEGWGQRRLLVGAMIGLWSLRLTTHLARRVLGEPEDGRYAWLREEWKPNLQAKLLVFFQAQALLVVLMAWPVRVAANVAAPAWGLVDVVALLVFAGALLGEAIADRQLAAWRSKPENKGRTCRRGLWRFSRHPNYFFEWLIWTSYPLMVLGRAEPLTAALVWLAPLALLGLILKVTGIPPTEAQALRSRGDDYRAYQRTTNAFFPGPPKQAPSSKATNEPRSSDPA